MDQVSLESCLQDLNLPAVRYFQTIDSTNDEAWRWVDTSGPQTALVVADEQTAGRGRLNRRWVTAPGSALAFSLVLYPPVISSDLIGRLVGLAALSISDSLAKCYSLHPLVKWPNDILLERRKTAGILVESRWLGEKLLAAVVGIGINIAPDSVNPRLLPPEKLNFPAICVELAVGHPVDRWELLHAVLDAFLRRLPDLALLSLLEEWQAKLAYRGQDVTLTLEPSKEPGSASGVQMSGKLVGLSDAGGVILLTDTGEQITVPAGELQLRLVGLPGK